ncbi:MAG: DUF3179 domain-containing protein [Phycisphaerae bacterium]|nr:DUF3179 domain-containing protein [Phycisphaerae bacterium]
MLADVAARRDTATAVTRRLDFRSGGWVLLLAACLALAILAWQLIWFVLPVSGSRAVGDGRDVDSYGFHLDDCLVPRERLVAAGFPKDGLRALLDPPPISTQEMDEQRLGRGSFLTPADRVIGVEIAGQARAYPLRIMIWHEVANDTLGGLPILVTCNPLCDAAFVFDRRVEGETLEFGVSGLLYNSNLLMFDRRGSPGDESLWSQMQARAVAGPAARRGAELRLLPCALTTWKEWRSAHPQTDVLRPDPARKQVYKREAYSTYAASPRLQFPVAPLPSVPETQLKAPCIGLRVAGGAWRVFSIAAPSGERPAGPQTVSLVLDGRTVTLRHQRHPPVAWLATHEDDVEVAYGSLFAWYALLGIAAEPLP